jgi:hypothetical protein
VVALAFGCQTGEVGDSTGSGGDGGTTGSGATSGTSGERGHERQRGHGWNDGHRRNDRRRGSRRNDGHRRYDRHRRNGRRRGSRRNHGHRGHDRHRWNGRRRRTWRNDGHRRHDRRRRTRRHHGTAGTTGAGGRGGTTGTAGTTGSGGTTGTAGTTGSGGSPPTQCTLQNHSGNGSFTWYNFAQGTARDGNGYRTACGYYGTANGTTDTVENIASMSPAAATYFVAVPGQNGFDSKSHCGECVQITGQNGRMIIATVIDECPYGSDGGNSACAANPGGHLDVSKTAFDMLGYPVGNPNGTNWKYVPCPVSGNVKVRFKSGNNNEFFVENVITPIASVSVNGTSASRQSYGAWHVGSAISTPATLNLTTWRGGPSPSR